MLSRTSGEDEYEFEEDEYDIEYILNKVFMNNTSIFIEKNLINYADKYYYKRFDYNYELITKITDMYCNKDPSVLRLNFPDLEIICIELIKQYRYYDDSFKLYIALPEQLNGHYEDMDVDYMAKIRFAQASYDPNAEEYMIHRIEHVFI